ncbi:MAG: DEAD/DEAH box helicase family protein [Holophagales bacterium]|nr:DEAD/DEAH box helicase family protein [Holophagales bacterium]
MQDNGRIGEFDGYSQSAAKMKDMPRNEPRNEWQTRYELIDPALRLRGWDETNYRVEVTSGGIKVIDGKASRRKGRTDYLLRLEVSKDTQPVAIALIEAKAESKPPGFGLSQGKRDGDCDRLNVKFIFSSNGHQFVEYDKFTGLTSQPKLMSEFPTTAELRRRYENGMGFSLESEAAKPLLVRYAGGESQRRYYQDAAIRAVFEKIAQGHRRALLSLATGAGKTFIAVNMLKHIADVGQLRKALFLCDRDELRTQAVTAFQNKFGANAAPVEKGNPQKNAKVIIATYQSLGISKDDDDASFLMENYPENYFSHIVIDECHRSAWGKWSQSLIRNSDAIQIGLTATPRQLSIKDHSKEAEADRKITADNLSYFGEPVYEYTMSQAIEDGYLAACEIRRGSVNLDDTGITYEEVMKHNPRNYITGEPVTEEKLKELYEKTDYESRIMLPDRVIAMCANLFQHLARTGTPEQKTIIFCVRDIHAEIVANEMNNLYSMWCDTNGRRRANNYAFKCTAESKGGEYVADMKGSNSDYFVAATVDLLSTGVDIPAVRNIVFFRYMSSPISFHQMVGRGTRLADNKLMFTIYDYTDATRLFGEDFISEPREAREACGGCESSDPPVIIRADGFEAEVSEVGRYIVIEENGQHKRVSIEEYKQGLARLLLASTSTLDEFRAKWIVQAKRSGMLQDIVHSGYSPELVRQIESMTDYDLYDVLADIAYGIAPRKRADRALSFSYKQRSWLDTTPDQTKAVILAIVAQFGREGSDALESQQLFNVAAIQEAGGLGALIWNGDPRELLAETKKRLFAA